MAISNSYSKLSSVALLLAASYLPTAEAACYVDQFGFERCPLSNGARVGIAIAIIVLAIFAIAAALSYRRRRMQGVTYVNQMPNNGQSYNNPSYNVNSQAGVYLPSYAPQAYTPPQYPPPVHGYDPQSGFAPPAGPPPGYYPSPQGPPPGKE